MDEPAEPESARNRRNGNLILLVCFAAIVGAGLWLISALDQHRKLDDCLTQGQRNCVPVDAQPR
jgi:hypothetical protein